MNEFVCDITFMAHTDRIEVRKFLCTNDFKKGDEVYCVTNGLVFKVENEKMLKLMVRKNEMLGWFYVKVIKEMK